jgi:hypothetical protein
MFVPLLVKLRMAIQETWYMREIDRWPCFAANALERPINGSVTDDPQCLSVSQLR